MGKLTDYTSKPTPLALADKLLGFDSDDTFSVTLQEAKDIILNGLTSNHNDLSGLNDGDYKHLTAAEKANFTAAKVTTVGTGGDYATVGAAITAGRKRLFLLSNTTETGNISLEANTHEIDFNIFTVNMQAFRFNLVQNTYLQLKNGTLTGSSSIFNCANGDCFYNFENMVLIAGSTMFLNQIHNITAFKCTFNFANIALAMVTDGLYLSTAIFSNCVFNGGGVSCNISMLGSTGTKKSMTDCETTGTFNFLGIANANNIRLKSGTVSKIQFYAVGGITNYMNNVIFPNTQLFIYASDNYANINNCVFNTIDFPSGSYKGLSLKNLELKSTSKQTFGGSNYTADGLIFNGDVDISGDNNIINAMRIQTTAGAKLTLLAGADNNSIGILHTKAATVNSGTNNTILLEKII